MKLYNTLTRKKEELAPVSPNSVSIYSCGPTVYWNQHIGHMYAYIHWDSLARYLRYAGYKVNWVMNITDVGHMTGENEGDADAGEDKMEKGARREGVSVWVLAEKYIKQFEDSLRLLNINFPDTMPRATKHIDEQIELIKKIEENGFVYKTDMGLVFDTSKFHDYSKFANLNLDEQKSRSDVAVDPQKKLPWDFFLWVTGNPDHAMKWDSPWGEGYPGWHIECTAMSTAYLGNKFDVHTGGVEHIPVHHTNEIAQGYGAFGQHTANFWIHNSWLTFKGEKMSKSIGNIYTVDDLVNKGYDPMHFRYLVLTSHYRKGLNFTFDALDAAKVAYDKLVEMISTWKDHGRSTLSDEKMEKISVFRDQFRSKIEDDLNYPEAIATLWTAAKSNIPNTDKLDLILDFDEILGLDLRNKMHEKLSIPEEIESMVQERERLRAENKYDEADEIRRKVSDMGFDIEDSESGVKIKTRR